MKIAAVQEVKDVHPVMDVEKVSADFVLVVEKRNVECVSVEERVIVLHAVDPALNGHQAKNAFHVVDEVIDYVVIALEVALENAPCVLVLAMIDVFLVLEVV